MKVCELIAYLQRADPNARVVAEKSNGDGCDTCGYGETKSEIDILDVNDLETRVVLTMESY